MGRSERGWLEQRGSGGSGRKLGQRAALSCWLWRGGRVGLGKTLHASWTNDRPDMDCLEVIDERGGLSQ